MGRTINNIIVLCILTGACYSSRAQTNYNPDSTIFFSRGELQEDFKQFREILENEHCCLYEYSSKAEMDSLFDTHYRLINRKMKYEEFFSLLAPITAKIGCLHTATWMPGRFFGVKPDMMFPLQLKLLDEYVIVTGSYLDTNEIPVGSIILEINGKPVEFIIEQLRKITSADALNPYFIDAQLISRFSMFYASIFGLPDSYEIKYSLPGRKTCEVKQPTPASIESVRKVIFSHFNNPPLKFKIAEKKNTAIMTVNTFIYYDKVDYFRNFMDSCFRLINEKKIMNLILDLRGNGGGDPFCASILFSYLQKNPVPYFAESYGKYAVLANPVPLPQNHFNGNLYTLIDGRCGSTNGHFCALLKYHNIGKFVGTPSGSTYKCNAGKNTEFRLQNSKIIITIGRSTYSAAVFNMDKTAPIMPDFIVDENYNDFLENKDLFIEKAMEQIDLDNQKKIINAALCQNLSYNFYPHLYDSTPEISSPYIMYDSVETILAVTKSNQYGIVPVTMENGKPLLYSYKIGTLMGKDQQMSIGAGDFPDLARTGLHSEDQLDTKEMITGIPIDIINCTGRPNAYSISGFMADDEDIISVLKGDNQLVRTMGLTHPKLAKPLFHIWNLILKEIELGNWARFYDNIKYIYYNGNINT